MRVETLGALAPCLEKTAVVRLLDLINVQDANGDTITMYDMLVTTTQETYSEGSVRVEVKD